MEGGVKDGAEDAGGTLEFAVTSQEGFSNWSLQSCQGGSKASCCSAVGPQQQLSPAMGGELGSGGGDLCHLVLQQPLGIPAPVGYRISLYKECWTSFNDALLV